VTPVWDDISWLDLLAVGGFFAIWLIYNLFLDGPLLRRSSINAQMVQIRQVWMQRLLERENRIVDSTLIGHSIHSATFFASTTIILLAGLVGVLGAADRVHAAFGDISVLLSRSQALFEVKLLLMIAIYAYAFFKFTWAIRQFNYFCAVVGSAPNAPAAAGDAELSRRMALILSNGAWQLNAGVRAHYFALASLGWFVHPLALIATTVLMVSVLVRRQMFSPVAQSIARHAVSLEGGGSGPGAAPRR
jgi:uncharacterized membrane protein